MGQGNESRVEKLVESIIKYKNINNKTQAEIDNETPMKKAINTALKNLNAEGQEIVLNELEAEINKQKLDVQIVNGKVDVSAFTQAINDITGAKVEAARRIGFDLKNPPEITRDKTNPYAAAAKELFQAKIVNELIENFDKLTQENKEYLIKNVGNLDMIQITRLQYKILDEVLGKIDKINDAELRNKTKNALEDARKMVDADKRVYEEISQDKRDGRKEDLELLLLAYPNFEKSKDFEAKSTEEQILEILKYRNAIRTININEIDKDISNKKHELIDRDVNKLSDSIGYDRFVSALLTAKDKNGNLLGFEQKKTLLYKFENGLLSNKEIEEIDKINMDFKDSQEGEELQEEIESNAEKLDMEKIKESYLEIYNSFKIENIVSQENQIDINQFKTMSLEEQRSYLLKLTYMQFKDKQNVDKSQTEKEVFGEEAISQEKIEEELKENDLLGDLEQNPEEIIKADKTSKLKASIESLPEKFAKEGYSKEEIAEGIKKYKEIISGIEKNELDVIKDWVDDERKQKLGIIFKKKSQNMSENAGKILYELSQEDFEGQFQEILANPDRMKGEFLPALEEQIQILETPEKIPDKQAKSFIADNVVDMNVSGLEQGEKEASNEDKSMVPYKKDGFFKKVGKTIAEAFEKSTEPIKNFFEKIGNSFREKFGHEEQKKLPEAKEIDTDFNARVRSDDSIEGTNRVSQEARKKQEQEEGKGQIPQNDTKQKTSGEQEFEPGD